MHPILRLYEDVLSSAETLEFPLPPLPRFIFVVNGNAAIGSRMVKAGEAWQGEREVIVRPGSEGVTCWRWELARGDAGSTVAGAPGMMTREKLTAFLETVPRGDLLMRGDSVSFPPGGCAYRHMHQGPGIRCLIEGGIRIDTRGCSNSYGPGGAWYETGPDPVFAQAVGDKSSRFIRVMILPRALIGKSSIRYVDDANKDKPKTQTYHIYADTPIEFEGWK